MKRTQVKVKDLPDQIGTLGSCFTGPRAILYCTKCHGEFSAHSGDYWNTPGETVLRCCRRNMLLVQKRTIFEEVRP